MDFAQWNATTLKKEAQLFFLQYVYVHNHGGNSLGTDWHHPHVPVNLWSIDKSYQSELNK